MKRTSAQTLLLNRFHSAWDRLAYWDLQGERFRYRDLWGRARALAERWRSIGVQPGQVVIVQLGSTVAQPIVHLAATMTGAVVCPVPLRSPPQLLEQARQWTQAPLEVSSPEVVLEAGCVDGGKPSDEDIEAKGNAPHGIFFSSGTTGNAKGICLSRDGFFGSAKLYGEQAGFGPATRLLHILPMGYMAGLVNTMFATLLSGGTVVSRQEFDPFYVARLWTDVRMAEANTLYVFPSIASIMAKLHDKSGFRRETAPPLTIHSTSAPLSAGIRRRFRAAFDYEILNCYGVTELGGPVSLQRSPVDNRAEDAGQLLKGFEARVQITTGDTGDLYLRSPNPMLGYLTGPWKDFEPQSHEDVQGYFPTRDLASFQGGVLTLHGRCDDVLNKGGIKIRASAVERVLQNHPAVEEAALFGLDDDTQGQRLVACVASDSGDPEALRRALSALPELSAALNNLHLDRLLVFPSFPKSHLGKTLKRELRRRAREVLGPQPRHSEHVQEEAS